MTEKAAPDLRRAGVIGWPVAHSLSPVIHSYWLDLYGLEGSYELLPVKPEKAHDFIRNLRRNGFVGANVTVPHKLVALEAADRVTDLAKRIGAVNTLYYEGDALVGTNSDAEGFYNNLLDGAPGWRAADGPTVVLGAGGAARAIICALLDGGVPNIRLLNRTRSKAEALISIDPARIEVADWETRNEALENANLLVNTTSLGMVGQASLDLDLALLPTQALVNDIVYKPLETDLLAAARARGNPVVDGLGMLLHQACAGFELWFGRKPKVTKELRAKVLERVVTEKTQ